jgi:hypothetical protein
MTLSHCGQMGYCCKQELSQVVDAAVLTVVGYNDEK